MDSTGADAGGVNVIDHGFGLLLGFIQQYGFALIFLAVVAFIAKGKWEEHQSRKAVQDLNGK